MLIKAVATSLGGVTFVGGGVAIYLYSSKGNNKDSDNSDKDNPELKTEDNQLNQTTEDNVSGPQSPIKKQEQPNKNKNTKKTIIKKAVTTSTYSSNKAPVNDSGSYFFLTKMNKNLISEDLERVKKMDFIIQNPDDFLIFEAIRNQTLDLPFYCFEGENVDSETELDLENLKKCKDIKSTIENKFVVIYYGEISGAERSSGGGRFSDWKANKPTFKYTLTKHTGPAVENTGEIISIFLNTFSPTGIKTSK